MVTSCEVISPCDHGAKETNERLKTYLQQIEQELKTQQKSSPHLIEAGIQPLETKSKLSFLKLNFEYQFFKLIKCAFYDPSLIVNEPDITYIMNFALEHCIQQFNMFGNTQSDNYDISFDEYDEQNMIEL